MKEQTFEYWYADPTGNITLLAEGSFRAEDYPALAKRLLAAEPEAEQVGFLEDLSPGHVSLRMAGDEFCGNAALSSAALALKKTGLPKGGISVDVYGLSSSLDAIVSQIGEDRYAGLIQMPSPEEILTRTFVWDGRSYDLPVVRFPGITHILTTQPFEKAFAETVIRKWCGELGASALGIMQIDAERGNLLPLVYVSAIDTLYWESSCASGTCAAAFWSASLQGRGGTFRFSEPGGVLGAEVKNDSLALSGTVTLKKKTLVLS